MHSTGVVVVVVAVAQYSLFIIYHHNRSSSLISTPLPTIRVHKLENLRTSIKYHNFNVECKMIFEGYVHSLIKHDSIEIKHF